MMEIKTLRHGVDSLDVAFQGALSGAVLGKLKAAKNRAIEAGAPEFVTIGDVSGYVGETGAKGGYSFVFDTGFDGEIWTIKDNGDLEQWNIFVSVRNAQLATLGYEAAKNGLWRTLEQFEARILAESLNRIDFAVDFISPDFVLCPNDFVNHSHSVRSEHSEMDEGGSEFGVRYSGRNTTSVTVGKMPGRQVIVYDKRREVMRQVGSHWFAIWGVEKETCPAIWRIELRAGKRHLKDWNITSFDDLDAKMGDMFVDAANQIRILDGAEYTNVTQAQNHAIWSLLQKTLGEVMGEHVSGVTRGQIRETKRQALADLLKKQMFGLATTYAVAMRAPYEATAFTTELFRDWRRYAKSANCAKSYEKAAKRYSFLDDKELPNDFPNVASDQSPDRCHQDGPVSYA